MTKNFSILSADRNLMTEESKKQTKKKFSPDWLVSGILTKFGEIFDRLTGRNWQPSSSLATSELSEKLKSLLDAEAKDLGGKGQFVPHNIKLKMQWDKFSTDADSAMKKLEYELLTAAIDHINDRRYHTYAPIKLEIKPDYFTQGVKLSASFDKFADEDGREAAVNVTVPDLKNVILSAPPEIQAEPEKEIFIAEFVVNDKPKRVELAFSDKQRLSVGRTKENDLVIDDQSISKIHASLILNSDKQLMVADTGSTNGTFINGQRIAYGKGISIKDGDKLNFGTVAIAFEYKPKEVEMVDDGEFQTQQDFITKDVAADELTSMPTVSFVTEDENRYKTNEDALQQDLSSVAKNEIETQEAHNFPDKLKSEEAVSTTKEGIVLDFGENN